MYEIGTPVCVSKEYSDWYRNEVQDFMLVEVGENGAIDQTWDSDKDGMYYNCRFNTCIICPIPERFIEGMVTKNA